MHPRPGYCIQTFSIAPTDKRNGVLISGRQFLLSDPNNEYYWDAFIYHVDSNTRLGLDNPKNVLVISDQFSIFPNPANNQITIENVIGSTYRYSILNAIGQIVESGIGKGEKTIISTENFAVGVYVIKIQDANNKQIIKKFLKD